MFFFLGFFFIFGSLRFDLRCFWLGPEASPAAGCSKLKIDFALPVPVPLPVRLPA